jgi:hypothetical protein
MEDLRGIVARFESVFANQREGGAPSLFHCINLFIRITSTSPARLARYSYLYSPMSPLSGPKIPFLLENKSQESCPILEESILGSLNVYKFWLK